MARIRTIKPEFFTSEDIVTLSPLARILYIATWLEADREGRLVWKPRTFKLRFLPGDNCDIEALCDQLVGQGLIVLYGDGLAFIPTFSRHQVINNRESASKLPAPDEYTRDSHASATRAHASGTPLVQDTGERKGKERKGKNEKPSSSAAQTTDTGTDKKAQKEQRLAEITDDAIAAFNQILGKPKGLLPAVHATVGKEKRRKQVGRILKVVRDICQEIYKDPHITKTFWIDYFTECDEDPFKSGRQPPGKGHENWSPSFEYLTREDVVIALFDKAQS